MDTDSKDKATDFADSFISRIKNKTLKKETLPNDAPVFSPERDKREAAKYDDFLKSKTWSDFYHHIQSIEE